MYVCMYVFPYVCMFICTYECVYELMYIFLYACMYVSYTCACTFVKKLLALPSTPSSTHCVAACCSGLQRVAACCSVLQCVASIDSIPQLLAEVTCTTLSALCCSMLQCVAAFCSVLHQLILYRTFWRNLPALPWTPCSTSLSAKIPSILSIVVAKRRRENGSYSWLCFVCLLCVKKSVCYSVLQRVAVCCSVLQYVAACCSVSSVLQDVAGCCMVLQGISVWCSVAQCIAVSCSVMHCATVRCSAVCCSVLQCVAAVDSIPLLQLSHDRAPHERPSTHLEYALNIRKTALPLSAKFITIPWLSHESIILQCDEQVLQCIAVSCSVLRVHLYPDHPVHRVQALGPRKHMCVWMYVCMYVCMCIHL